MNPEATALAWAKAIRAKRGRKAPAVASRAVASAVIFMAGESGAFIAQVPACPRWLGPFILQRASFARARQGRGRHPERFILQGLSADSPDAVIVRVLIHLEEMRIIGQP